MNVYEKHLMADPRLPFIFHDYVYNPKKHKVGFYSGWHENIEILYFKSGSATVTINDIRVNVSAEDIVVIDTNRIHSIIAHEKTHFYCLIVDRAFCLSNHFDTNLISFEHLIRDTELSALFDEFVKEYYDTSSFRIQALRAVELKIMVMLCRRYSQDTQKPVNDSNILSAIKRALGYIHSESDNPITLEDISNTAGISKYYLAREFRKITGYTIVTYINQVRCEKAAAMLTEKTMNIENIATACGFTNISYFTRTFTKLVGMNPRDFRANFK